MSAMRRIMETQPGELRRILDDAAPAENAAARLAGRRILLVGVGTSWHAAHHGAWLLREAGVQAEAVHAADVAPYQREISPQDAVIVLSHTAHTGYSVQMLERAREARAAVVFVGPNTRLTGPPARVQALANHDNHLHVRLAPRASR